ncbi:Polyadenylate-binding protein [Mycena chlorophos]|uniref:Polyadenylate-binding protein n=1 Tax=Mycena chlorophos TaxID=658473 RepID=A0A8H6WLH6_MYCCL|nr:Polyadenylate-binding protein [Mycena chlorophos]
MWASSDPTVTEAMLFEIFNMIGPVASHSSLPWVRAYVNYLNAADGERALETLNYSLIKNRACRIMWSRLTSNGLSKGYGFVHSYETAEAAESAIKAVNGMLLNDKKVYVGHPHFAQGFGFVNYESHEAAQAAVEALNDTEINGRKLYVGRAQKKAEREEELRKSYEQAKMEKLSKYQGVNLYIKNLEDDMDDDKLRAEFEPFGTVTSCKVMRDDKGTSKGFGFVCFSSPDEATKAVAEMNNKMIGTKPLYVSLAQRREVRRQQLESQIAQRNQIRMQQAAAAGIPGGYMNGPMYYPPGPGFPPQGRGMMGYGQPGMMPPRPRYPPNNGGMPIPAPYQGGPPQPYGAMPAGFRGGQPRAAGARGPGSPTLPNASIPRPGGAPPANAPRAPAAAGAPAAGARAPANAARAAPAAGQPGYKLNPQVRNGAPPAPAGPEVTAAALANASPMEQKQMLGEVIYMKIAASQPELAGKITGMLLEMDNGELLHLLDSPDAMNAKVNEALIVLQEFVNKDEA